MNKSRLADTLRAAGIPVRVITAGDDDRICGKEPTGIIVDELNPPPTHSLRDRAMKLTVHLSTQSQRAIRPGDGVSPRLNQIIDRYQALMRHNPLQRLRLNAGALLDLRLTMPPRGTPAIELREAWADRLADRDTDLAELIGKTMNELEVLQTFEALESAALEACDAPA